MNDQRTADEREEQIAALQAHRKRHGKKWRELRPRTLLRAMAVQEVISLEQIRKMVEKQYSDPVLSLYMRLDPGKVTPEPNAMVRSFHSLKTRALEERRDFIESLPKSQKDTLEHDLKEIEAFLGEYFEPVNLRSLVVFKSGQKLNRVIKLGVRSADTLTIDPDPYIIPLEAVLEENDVVLFVEVSKEESRIHVYQLGNCEQVDRIQSFVPTDTVDKSIPGHAQRHRLTHLQWHLKHTANAAYRLFRERACSAVVLMAESRILGLLEEYLHESLTKRIIGRIENTPAANARDRTELIEGAVREHRGTKETKAIESLGNLKPGEDFVSSLQEVISACNLFQVRKLLLSESLSEKGFVCREHHYLSLDEGSCPFDGTNLLSVENVIDEMVEMARMHGVNVVLIEQRDDLLAKYGHIAAVLYPGMRGVQMASA